MTAPPAHVPWGVSGSDRHGTSGVWLMLAAERWGFWPANAVGGATFVSMHWPHRIWRDGFGPGVFADAVPLFAIAIALGFVVWRTGSIWPAVVFHAANNTLSGVL
jgi:membrane protease YdiL (CAAX protease family)